MTCRIRAGEVARPRCRGFTPRAARSGHGVTVPATRRAWVLHSCRSTSVDRSSARRQDSASARTAPPLWRGLVVRHGSSPTDVRKSQRNRGFVLLLTTHPFGWTPVRSNGRRSWRRAPDQHRNAPFRHPGTRVAQPGRCRKRTRSYAERGYVIWSVSTRRPALRRRRVRRSPEGASTALAWRDGDTGGAPLPVQRAQRPREGGRVRLRPAALVHQGERVAQLARPSRERLRGPQAPSSWSTSGSTSGSYRRRVSGSCPGSSDRPAAKWSVSPWAGRRPPAPKTRRARRSPEAATPSPGRRCSAGPSRRWPGPAVPGGRRGTGGPGGAVVSPLSGTHRAGYRIGKEGQQPLFSETSQPEGSPYPIRNDVRGGPT